MKNFIDACLRTECDYVDMGINPRLVHAITGVHTESGELTDAMKKHWFYKQPLDLVNVKEEIGDILYYLAILCNELGTDFDTEMIRVIEKLKIRYPEKFTTKNAIDRDLSKERASLNETNKQI